MLLSILDWRLKTPFYYGWLILAIAATATFAASGVTQVVMGGIQVYIADDTGWSRSTLSYSTTIGTWCSGLLAPVVGRLADKFGPRWLMPAGLITAGVCYFFLAGSNSVWQFYVAYIVARSVTNPILVGLVPHTAAVNFFLRRRNMALAMVSTFRPVASAINLQLISFITAHQSWRAAYRYLGVFTLVLLVPVVLFMRRRPEDIGLLPDGGSSPARGEGQRGGVTNPIPEDSWTAREAFHSRAFWLIVITACVGTLASSSTGFGLVPYLVENAGLSNSAAAGVLSLGTFLAVANLGWGYLADIITPRRCLIITMVGSAAMLVYVTTVGSLVGALGFAVVWGVFSGAVGSLEIMVLAQYYGRGSYGTILGAYAPFQMTALGLGPGLSSITRDLSGEYTVLYLAMAGAYLVSAVLMFLARPPVKPSVRTAEEAPAIG